MKRLAQIIKVPLRGRSPFDVFVDLPRNDSAHSGSVAVVGWAYSTAGKVTQVEVLDRETSTSLGFLTYGFERPDVVGARPWQKDSFCGFSGTVDLQSAGSKRKTLIVRVTDAGCNRRELARTIQIGESEVSRDSTSSGRGRAVGVPNLSGQYQVWLQHHLPTKELLKGMTGAASRFSYRPTFSILMPVYNTPVEFLRLAIQSVLDQVYPEWELCIVDDGSTDPRVKLALQELAVGDARIRVLFSDSNQGIAGATNEALEMACGEFIGLLDHDDELWAHALYECAKLLNERPDADMIYSDEDKVTTDGYHYEPFFKPDWSPDLLTSMMYTCHFSVYRRELVQKSGGFRAEYSGSQDYDLALRITENTDRIHHIPTVLYSWRTLPGSAATDSSAKPYALIAAERALGDAIQRRGWDAAVEPGIAPGRWRIRFRTSGETVTLILPTGGNPNCLEACLRSLLDLTDHQSFEVLVVDNSEDDRVRQLASSLERDDARLRYLEFRCRPFNFSAIVNFAVKQVSSPFIGILNDDITVCRADWLEAMVEHAQRQEVGVVGAKLLYPDDTLQHAGVILGVGGVAEHLFRRYPKGHSGPFDLIEVTRNVSAVTFACVVLRRGVYEEMGGLDAEHLAVAFNDVDFCLRVQERGYRVIYTPHAELYHHESATRSSLPLTMPGENEFMQQVWAEKMRHDPFYNRHLSKTRADYSLAIVQEE